MGYYAFYGARRFSGASFTVSLSPAATSSCIGVLTYCSYRCLRGWNHSRRLLRFRLRKNCVISGGKPGKRVATICSLLTFDKMPLDDETIQRLADIPNLTVSPGALLSGHTRFAIGGPAQVYRETPSGECFSA